MRWLAIGALIFCGGRAYAQGLPPPASGIRQPVRVSHHRGRQNGFGPSLLRSSVARRNLAGHPAVAMRNCLTRMRRTSFFTRRQARRACAAAGASDRANVIAYLETPDGRVTVASTLRAAGTPTTQGPTQTSCCAAQDSRTGSTRQGLPERASSSSPRSRPERRPVARRLIPLEYRRVLRRIPCLQRRDVLTIDKATVAIDATTCREMDLQLGAEDPSFRRQPRRGVEGRPPCGTATARSRRHGAFEPEDRRCQDQPVLEHAACLRVGDLRSGRRRLGAKN